MPYCHNHSKSVSISFNETIFSAKKMSKAVRVLVSDSQHRGLKRACASAGVSMSDYLRAAMAQLIEVEKNEQVISERDQREGSSASG